MQITYTFVRPSTAVPFVDVSLPGYNEYHAEFMAAGFEHHESISMDYLTFTLIHIIPTERMVEYEALLDAHAAFRQADQAEREANGVTVDKVVVQ